MLERWPIRNKLLTGVALFVLILGSLSWSGFYGLYEYRGLVKSLDRVAELQYATELAGAITDLRLTTYEVTSDGPRTGQRAFLSGIPEVERPEFRARRDALRQRLLAAREAQARYRQQLDAEGTRHDQLDDRRRERETTAQIEQALDAIEAYNSGQAWVFDSVATDKLRSAADRLQVLTAELPNYLHVGILQTSTNMKDRFSVILGLGWISAGLTVAMLTLLVGMVCHNMLRPLRELAQGSLRIAGGDFSYRISLPGRDEMAELAAAMNDTTNRFVAVRDDLASQVQQRSEQIVRSERLASVGFLAAGISHEINNPLASIALCAESLEGRLQSQPLETMSAADREVLDKYLHMIHREAARCRQITARLLDFSRWGDVAREPVELGALVQEMIDMLAHLPRYRGQEVQLVQSEPVVARVNAQEFKQVVVNLLTNALESLDDREASPDAERPAAEARQPARKGKVTIELRCDGGAAQMDIIDNGCGMSADVQQRLFEPFFTRRRGGNGTGLGLTIADRIVRGHGGVIRGRSGGPGAGSTFSVRLPVESASDAPTAPPARTADRRAA